MHDVDLNLLVALDALLRERSVSAAARRLGLSTSAMSRTLSRLRGALGDPVLVPAGRAMVPTPHAEAIAEAGPHAGRRVAGDAAAVRRRSTSADDGARVHDPGQRGLHAALRRPAERGGHQLRHRACRLRFAPKPDKDIEPLRDGTIDLEIGVISGDGAELRGQTLYRDAFVGIARTGHPLLDAPVTPERLCAWGHVVFARRRGQASPADEALAELGLSRRVNVIVPGFPAVIAVVSASDLLGLVPRSACLALPSSGTALFDLPIPMPDIVVSQIWHPRMDADAGHSWLRGLVFGAFRKCP